MPKFPARVHPILARKARTAVIIRRGPSKAVCTILWNRTRDEFKLGQWDHVSWPGNDYFGGSRCTDDGVKAAATDSMAVLTGIEGHYDPQRGAYLPPVPYRTWDDVVRQNGLRL